MDLNTVHDSISLHNTITMPKPACFHKPTGTHRHQRYKASSIPTNGDSSIHPSLLKI